MERNVSFFPQHLCSGLQNMCPFVPQLLRAQRLSCFPGPLFALPSPDLTLHPFPSLVYIFSIFSSPPRRPFQFSTLVLFAPTFPLVPSQPYSSTSHCNICKLGVLSSSQDICVRRGFEHNSYTKQIYLMNHNDQQCQKIAQTFQSRGGLGMREHYSRQPPTPSV